MQQGQWIEIVNWTQYNPRKDVTHSSWFRLEHRLLDHPDYEHFSAAELMVWVALLSAASLGNKGTFRLNRTRVMVRARATEAEVDSALAKLLELKCIKYPAQPAVEGTRDGDVTPTSREPSHERTLTIRNDTYTKEEKDIGSDAPGQTHEDTPPPLLEEDELDFETLWQSYPEGQKSEARKRFEKHIRTPAIYAELKKAITNYLADCTARERFKKDFSTFIGTERRGHPWREWVQRAPAPRASPMREDDPIHRVVEAVSKFESGRHMVGQAWDAHASSQGW